MNGLRCEHVKDVLGLFEPEELLDGRNGRLRARRRAWYRRVRRRPQRASSPAQYLRYFKMGDGPFYVFYTPWHLPHAEACR